MNELIFFLQIAVLLSFTFVFHRLGKESLIAWVAVQALIANLFVIKQITLFGLNVTASDAFAIGSLLGLNLLQEFYTQKDAQKATLVCFFFMLFFAIAAKMHLLYIPSSFDESHAAFTTLLTPAPRLFIASLSVFFLIQQFDIRFFKYLKKRLPNANFSFRSAISLTLSQFLDTVLFSFAGLYGLVESVAEIILFSFAIKMIVIAFSAPIMKYFQKWEARQSLRPGFFPGETSVETAAADGRKDGDEGEAKIPFMEKFQNVLKWIKE